jgi:hypothetical protein
MEPDRSLRADFAGFCKFVECLNAIRFGMAQAHLGLLHLHFALSFLASMVGWARTF